MNPSFSDIHEKIKINSEEIEQMKSNYTHWESKAEEHDSHGDVSWGDKNMMVLEINNIRKFIIEGMHILDAGCSNGFSTFQIAADKNVTVKAFDYSDRAIEIAKREQVNQDRDGKISFYCGNILDIKEDDNVFDLVYNIRVLINLPNWRLQQKAINEIHRVIKPGGIYLLSEAFTGSLENLNKLRAAASMKPLKAPEFNLYLEEKKLADFIRNYFEIRAIKCFSSIYYVASRFLRYLTMKTGEKDSYDNTINNMFAGFEETENSGDFGVQKLYVLKKRL